MGRANFSHQGAGKKTLERLVMSYTIGLLLEAPPSDDALAFEQFNALAEGSDIEEAHPTFVAIEINLQRDFPASVICPIRKWMTGSGAMARS